MTDQRTVEVDLALSSPTSSPAREIVSNTPALISIDIPFSVVNTKSSSASRPRSKSLLNSLNASSSHKRSSSGNILSKFPFFRATSSNDNAINNNASSNTPSVPPARNSSEATPPVLTSNATTIPFPPAPISTASDSEQFPPQHQQRNPIFASVIEAQSKSRRRKGSLRKTAILMGNHLRLDHRRNNSSPGEKDGSLSKRSTTPQPQLPTPPGSPTKRELKSHQTSPTKKTFIFELPSANSSSDTFNGSIGSEEKEQPQLKLKLDTILLNTRSSSKTPTMLSPIGSPITLETSVISNDDLGSRLPPLSRPALSPQNLLPPVSLKMHSPSPSPSSSESSLPQTARRRKQSLALNKSPLTSPLVAPIIGSSADFPNDEWDYSETEWWGWITLVVTWIVVVVGMGSCLGVWSWAWDVGPKPYAPPELEDDPTLPIVGYYPALMVLTAVMSWVWVVVAWVGMKYFKHAKIQNEDT